MSIVRPRSVETGLLESDGSAVYYRARVGDSYLNLAHALGVDPETVRADNELWRLQQLEPGVRLRLRLPADSPFRSLVRGGERPVGSGRPGRASHRWKGRAHRVRRGETLDGIAKRYGTTTRRLREVNQLHGSRTQEGMTLTIPNAEGSRSRSARAQRRVRQITRVGEHPPRSPSCPTDRAARAATCYGGAMPTAVWAQRSREPVPTTCVLFDERPHASLVGGGCGGVIAIRPRRSPARM